ncbi:hypothetical protein FXO38_25402 [Capsicum annuum]|uniref:Uncharacterized protein n=1 Tax=Capsicum annuum TaxID=4072 RepID=A0A2G2ZJ12_CAPAN|nr:hypothetical protein FXO38_25402 [Capsicum annuum]KAF3656668.1 hypothetical protein FXO37_15365 [Capsicum annuum]PHT81973.1 hypothetical protein T459_14988 [Capsicum annuum]
MGNDENVDTDMVSILVHSTNNFDIENVHNGETCAKSWENMMHEEMDYALVCEDLFTYSELNARDKILTNKGIVFERDETIEDEGDQEVLKKEDALLKSLREKEEEYDGLDALNQTLIVKERNNNDELHNA